MVTRWRTIGCKGGSEPQNVNTKDRADQMNAEFPYFTLVEAAYVAKESSRTLQRRIDTGVIRPITTSTGSLISKEELDAYLNRRGPKLGRRRYRAADLMRANQSDDQSSKGDVSHE